MMSEGTKVSKRGGWALRGVVRALEAVTSEEGVKEGNDGFVEIT